MGVKIKSTIKNLQGIESNSFYINIGDKFIIDKKSGYVFLTPQIWVSESARDAGENPLEMIEGLGALEVSSEEFETLIYSKLKEKLVEKLEITSTDLEDVLGKKERKKK